MTQKALWKLNLFCSSFHNVEVLCVYDEDCGSVKSEVSCCTGSFASCISLKLWTLLSVNIVATSKPLVSYCLVVMSLRNLALCQIAAQKFSLMILTFHFQIEYQDEHQYADFPHNLQAIF